MWRASELLRKPVIVAASGDCAGRVTNLFLDEEHGTFLGLMIHRGPFARSRVLPFADIVAIGPQFVVARDRESLVRPRDVPQIQPDMRAIPLKGKPLITGDGQHLGRLVDVRIDMRNGRIDGYELSSGGLSGLLGKRRYLPATVGSVVAGADAIVAPAGAAEAVQSASPEPSADPLPTARS